MKTSTEFENTIAGIDHNTPFLLLPVRLETHFRKRNGSKELCVRIYPSEVHLDYLAEKLTEQEALDGKTFWLQWFIASGSKEREYEAWEKLCSKYPSYRAAWIVRCLKPENLDSWKPGGEYFYRRPHTSMEEIENSCSHIISYLSEINLDEKGEKNHQSGEYRNEELIRINIGRIKEELFAIDRDIMFNEYVVDYLYDHIKNTLDYLIRRLDSFIAFYKKFSGIYEGNLRNMELWDVDATMLYTFRKDVDSFVQRFSNKRISLQTMVDMYLNNPLHDIFPVVEITGSENPDFPMASLLPDRFIFIGETSQGKMIVQEGNAIEDNIAVSPMPEVMDSREPFVLDEKANIVVQGDFSWAIDYERAVEKGMAITVPLDTEIEAFNYIYVLGVRKHTGNALKSLINSHIYSKGGLEILAPGTATNNVDGVTGKFCGKTEEEAKRIRYNIEVEEDFRNDRYQNSDANILSRYLGLDSDILMHSLNYNVEHVAKARNIYKVLFDYFNGFSLPHMEPSLKELVERIEAFVLENVNAGGLLPTLKIGDHPYGILPVVDYKKMRGNFMRYGTSFELKLYDVLIELADRWHLLRKQLVVSPAQIKGSEADKNYLFMAGQTPYSVTLNIRDMIYNPYLPKNCTKTGIDFFEPFAEADFFSATPVRDAYLKTTVSKHELFGKLKNIFKDEDERELEIIVCGFLDIFAHRLDAWLLGLLHAAHRDYMKNSQVQICTGAYGWVFNLKENRRDVRPDGEKVALDMEINDHPANIYDSGHKVKGEYIVAPSVQHAITAAILRSSYLKTQKDSSDSHMCVNLTSMRARQALRMLEGIKSGMATGIVLGADLERYMHESYKRGNELDKYIYPLRRLFPQSIDLEAEDKRAGNHIMQVINGETLLNTFLDKWDNHQSITDWLTSHCHEMEWFRILDQATSLSSDSGQMKALFNAIEKMADSYDALNDLLLAEGVYRMTVGDKDSFYAVSRFMAEGKGNLPTPAVLDSPSDYVAFSTKAGIILPSKGKWSEKMFGMAEPYINAWVSSLLGSMDELEFVIVEQNPQGIETEEWGTLQKLGIEPLEYMYLSDNEILLKKLIEMKWREQNKCYQNHLEVRLNFCDNISDIKELVLTSRSMNGDDFVNRHLEDTDLETFVDIEELKERYQYLSLSAISLYNKILQLLKSAASVNVMKDDMVMSVYHLLMECAESGMYGVLPSFDTSLFVDGLNDIADKLVILEGQKKQKQLLLRLEETAGQLKERIDAAEHLIDGITEKCLISEKYIDAIKQLTLKNFKICPKFILERAVHENERPVMEKVIQKGLTYYRNITQENFDEWESDLSEVNEAMELYNKISMFQIVNDREMGKVAIIQSDAEGNIDSDIWLGVKVEGEGQLMDADSFVIYHAEELGRKVFVEGKERSVSGLMMGSWLEYIPYRKKTAGIALHVDMPDNEAPQCMLLAMHPYHGVKDSSRKWGMADMLELLDTTRFMIMNRAVEPDMLYGDKLLSAIFPLLSTVDISKMKEDGEGDGYSSFVFTSSFAGMDMDEEDDDVQKDVFYYMPGGKLLK